MKATVHGGFIEQVWPLNPGGGPTTGSAVVMPKADRVDLDLLDDSQISIMDEGIAYRGPHSTMTYRIPLADLPDLLSAGWVGQRRERAGG